MRSRPVGEWSNRSWMHGVAQDRMGLRSMRLVARGRMKPTSCWRAMAGAGGQLVSRGPVVIRTDRAANKFFRCSRQQGDAPSWEQKESPRRRGEHWRRNFEPYRLRCLKVDGEVLPRLGWTDGVRVSDQCVRASRQIMLELLAEVPIAASLGGIRPIPAQVDRR